MPRQAAPPPARGEIAEVVEADAEAEDQEERWARLLPELLSDVVRRVEASGCERWPARKDVVSCASVCRRWREAAATFVRPLPESGKITFPASLKQPGPKDFPIQCFIKRNKKNSTFYLYLGLRNNLTVAMDKGKFLMAAKRFRWGAHTEYIISLDADDLSQGNRAYLGKLRRSKGHLTLMLQLAGILHAAGVPSADLLPSGSDMDFAGTLLWINDRLREPFRDRLCQALAKEEDGGGVAVCLVVDSNLRGMQLVTEELGRGAGSCNRPAPAAGPWPRDPAHAARLPPPIARDPRPNKQACAGNRITVRI